MLFTEPLERFVRIGNLNEVPARLLRRSGRDKDAPSRLKRRAELGHQAAGYALRNLDLRRRKPSLQAVDECGEIGSRERPARQAEKHLRGRIAADDPRAAVDKNHSRGKRLGCDPEPVAGMPGVLRRLPQHGAFLGLAGHRYPA